MTRLGPSKLAILAAIMDRPGHPPTVLELAAVIGSRNPEAAAGHLRRLRELGLVTWEQGINGGRSLSRTIRSTCKFIPADELAPTQGESHVHLDP